MVVVQEFLWAFYIFSLVAHFLQGLFRVISMALSLNSPPCPSPSWPSRSFVDCLSERFAAEECSHETGFPSKRRRGEKGLHESVDKLDTMQKISSGCGVQEEGEVKKGSVKVRKRPARIVVPELCQGFDQFCEGGGRMEEKEIEVEERDFCLASKKGKRDVMEDGYGFKVDIGGDPQQAFFTVIDGHGGRAAVDYVAENLGNNIVKALENIENSRHGDNQLQQAIKGGYLVTDKEFLSKGVSSGACAASVLFKDGELHAANVGDCKVVLSRNGVADPLTKDHRPCREDERFRIENSGGFVHCCNGVWRVQGSLAVSRAIGDQHLKEWIISEPEIKKLHLTMDCEFLIMASDGLWDKVNDQEAVDLVLREKNSLQSCKKLVDLSTNRGNKDDITVMVINLQRFIKPGN